MSNKKKYDNSIIINFWNAVFSILEQISIFNLIRYILKLFKKQISYRFVEGWVVFNLMFAFLSSLFIYNGANEILASIIALYGVLRIFEIVVYQINVLIFHPYRSQLNGKKYSIKSPTRIVVLLFHNYFEIIFWYASIFMAIHTISNIALGSTWFEYIKQSILCFATFDTTLVNNSSLISAVSHVAFSELIAGVFMTIVSLARFIGLLPEVESIEKL